jgi:hypothetical protein
LTCINTHRLEPGSMVVIRSGKREATSRSSPIVMGIIVLPTTDDELRRAIGAIVPPHRLVADPLRRLACGVDILRPPRGLTGGFAGRRVAARAAA